MRRLSSLGGTMNSHTNKSREYHYDYSNQPFSCDMMTSPAAGNTEFHMHNRFELYYLLDGYVQYFVENVCYNMTPGSLILFSSNEIHKAINTTNTPFSRIVIHVSPDFIKQYCTSRTNLLTCFHRKPGEGNLVFLSDADRAHFLELAHSLKNAINGTEHYGNDILATALVLQLLVLINEAWNRTAPKTILPSPHRTQAIMNYIDSHLTESLTLDSISSALSLDKYYLSHLFKSETESTIFQYVLVKRVALAKTLLSQDHTVSEVCHLSGFNDYSNFIRSFKQTTGYTPGQFKKILNNHSLSGILTE